MRGKSGRADHAPLPNPISLKLSVQLELGYEMILIAKHDEKNNGIRIEILLR